MIEAPYTSGEPDDWYELRTAVRRLLDKEAPMSAVREWDARHEYPQKLYDALAEAGYIAMPFPEERGGAGAGPLEMLVVGEELGRRGMDVAGGYGMNVFLGMTLDAYGSERVTTELVPAVLAGRRRLSIGLTEPDAGSDAAAISTIARASSDGYSLHGQKVFTTGAGLPNTTMLVAAKAEGDRSRSGMSIFVVDADAPGVTLNRLDTVGRYMLGTYEVFLDDVRIPADARLGDEGTGWRVLRSGLNMERLFGCGAYAGALSTVISLAAEYARSRKQFGQPIADFQAVSHPIADMYADLGASRLLAYAAARELVAGGDARRSISIAKLFNTEAYQRATNHAMQIFGGYGYMKEYDIERYWRDARISTITAGTSQIQREIILTSLGLRT